MSSTGNVGVPSRVGRGETIGKVWKTVNVVLTYDEIALIDEVAGPGNRSAYIRHLVDTVDGSEAKRLIELESDIKILARLLKKREMELEALQKKYDNLKGKGKGKIEIPHEVLHEIKEQYGKWKQEVGARMGSISMELQMSWIEARAKSIGVKPNELKEFLSS